MVACLPTQADGLIRLKLAALAGDDHSDSNSNVIVIIQINVVN